MATPHSLPSTPQRTTAQLPFSPSLSGNVAHRLPGAAARSHSGSTSSKPPHTRSGSVISSRSRGAQNMSHVGEPSLTSSASVPISQPRPTSGTTHAGGILPSASFFHPSRPNYSTPSPPPPLPRPSTADSITSIEEGSTVDALHLGALGPLQNRVSEGTDSAEYSTEDLKAPTLAPSVRSTSMKYSREPLLPIGGGPSRKTVVRPSVVTQNNPYERSESNVSAGGRMRDSFEKLFKRGFTFEGNRRSPITAGPSNTLASFVTSQRRSTDVTPVSPSSVARMTFELNVTGAQHSPVTPTSHRKHSLSPLQGSTTSITHFSFNPVPPRMDPPLSAVPVLNTKGKPFRNYELHPSRNRFFLGGRLLTGGDSPWAFVASLMVVLGITGVWFGTTCVWWWLNESPAVAAVGAYMCLLTISSMLATAFRDPGILPRDLDPDPPYPASSSSEGSLRAPLPRDLKCDNCVDGCDHHCQWVNNCVGRRNYTAFFTFLFSAVTTLVLVICTTALHLFLLTRKAHLGFRQAVATPQGVGSAVAFSMSIVVIWPVMALLTYHLRLLLLNVTTIEQIRNQAHRSLGAGAPPPNPFSHGNWRRNLVYMLCRPPGSSWLDARGIATEDKREVNPGLLEHDGWPADVEQGRKGE
ncbi:putative palmitoyltransferase ZDHHC14 [Grifola frondosa]|uniref:Palmitoyltransferase n=1 Tax=Grifola frondosa TaxID=5627 RepID=A0A1C7LYX9_GRIFR|nr:putative palmitoyltransferase ZDHHC14 [Grifola frondosa]